MWLALYFFWTAVVGRIKICLEVWRTLAKRQTKVFSAPISSSYRVTCGQISLVMEL